MSLFDRESVRDADEPVPELFDIHVMLFGAEPHQSVAALMKIFGVDQTTAQRIVDSAPVTVKRGVDPERGGHFVDLLSGIGAQVVLMPAEQSDTPVDDALTLPEPPPQVSADAAGGGWGGLDIEPQSPAPATHAMGAGGGLGELDVPTRSGARSQPQPVPANQDAQQQAATGPSHGHDVHDSLFAPDGRGGAGAADAGAAGLIERNSVVQEPVRSHETVSAPFADMIERHTMDAIDAPVAEVRGGGQLDVGHAEAMAPAMGDDLLDVDAPSAELFGGDEGRDGGAPDDDDFEDDGPANLSPAVAAALRMPMRGTRRSGRRIAREAKPVGEGVAAAVRARALAEQQIDAEMEGVVMSQPPPVNPPAASAPPGPPSATAEKGASDLGLGDVPPLPSLPPLPPPPGQAAASTGGMPKLPEADTGNPLPPPPGKKQFRHRDLDDDSAGLPALNLGPPGGASPALPDPSSEANAKRGAGGGGGYWSAKRGGRNKDEAPTAGDGADSSSGAPRGDASGASLELDDGASAGKFQRQHVEVADTTSAPVRAIALIGGALCVLAGGLLLDNTILFGNATPLSLAAHAFFFYGLGAGLAELKTE